MLASSFSLFPVPSQAVRRGPFLGLLALYVMFQGLIGYRVWDTVGRYDSGIVVHLHGFGEQRVAPSTPEAEDTLNALRLRAVNGDKAQAASLPIRLVAINGEAIDTLGDPLVQAFERLVHVGPGQENSFVLLPGDGPPVEVVIPCARVLLSSMELACQCAAAALLGLIYVALGFFVWWKRPSDLAAPRLFIFTLLIAMMLVSMSASWAPGPPLSRAVLMLVTQTSRYMAGPVLLSLCLAFTGYHRRPFLRGCLRVFYASGLLSCCALWAGVAWGWPGWGPHFNSLHDLWVLIALWPLVMSVSLKASRAPNPVGLRRRARVLGAACLLSFTLPSISGVLRVDIPWPLIFTMLGVFPALVAYATVRLGAFDLRLVIGQGLLYVLLSVSVLLGYLGLAYVGVSTLEQGDNPWLVGVAMAVFVVVLSLGQLRVQRFIDRLVFRGRYVYAEALADASAHLARARRNDEILATAGGALMGAMRLGRAGVVTRDGDGKLRYAALGHLPDPVTSEPYPGLPMVFAIGEFAPIERTWLTGQAASAHDQQVTSQQVHLDGAQAAPQEEAGFWPYYGIEWIIPLHLGRQEQVAEPMRGLLLLGPKQNGRPFDGEDRKLIRTLANQMAVALDNAEAFEEIERLKDSLEVQVERRTEELSKALADLERTQGQLIESAKQALLGRLVAGIVHEMNSPLGALRSSVDTVARVLNRMEGVLEQEQGPQRTRSVAKLAVTAQGLQAVLLESSARIEGLLGSLKRFVALDEGPTRLFDVCEGIDGALTLLGHRIGTSIKVEKHYEDGRPQIRCHPARLNQVFLNVIENAIQALNGAGELRIHVHRGEGETGVEIRVSDSGCGMSAEMVDKLFEYGFTTKNGRVGLRVSLPANWATVQELGGEMAVESRPGEGTLVTLRLPAPMALTAGTGAQPSSCGSTTLGRS